MKYLISTVETYRADTQEEAENLIKKAKAAKEYTLTKSTNEIKYVKAKGEIIDSYYKVSLTKSFTDIKEPEDAFNVKYSLDGTFGEEDE